MKANLKIDGMHCGSCATAIELVLRNDVRSVNVNYDKKVASIDFDEKKLKLEELRKRIENLGYKVSKM